MKCIGKQIRDVTCQHCICGKGYEINVESGCEDIDECKINNGNCDPLVKCSNFPGGRHCADCPPGYFGYGDDRCFEMHFVAAVFVTVTIMITSLIICHRHM